ncbi:MAG: arylesterase [Deferrisomatales bacterium]|nr:arylesterase [Deferrisomatales bacterium]
MIPSTPLRILLVLVLLSIAPPWGAVNAGVGAAPPPVRIAVLGDSLVAGYGLALGDSFPAQLERALVARGHGVEVLNHGVSGDTSAGGRQRVEWMLRDHPAVVIVELGANDALRGLDAGQLEANLDAILASLKKAGVAPLLAGMRAPRNLGSDYAERFDAVYPRLAARHRVGFYPFFLEGVAGVEELNQRDGLHPNARGVARIVAGILPAVEEVLGAAGQ